MYKLAILVATFLLSPSNISASPHNLRPDDKDVNFSALPRAYRAQDWVAGRPASPGTAQGANKKRDAKMEANECWLDIGINGSKANTVDEGFKA